MATIRKRGTKHRARYHVQVRRKGTRPITRSFATLHDAKTWARNAEVALDRQHPADAAQRIPSPPAPARTRTRARPSTRPRTRAGPQPHHRAAHNTRPTRHPLHRQRHDQEALGRSRNFGPARLLPPPHLHNAHQRPDHEPLRILPRRTTEKTQAILGQTRINPHPPPLRNCSQGMGTAPAPKSTRKLGLPWRRSAPRTSAQTRRIRYPHSCDETLP